VDRLYNNGRRVIVSTAGADVAAVADTVRGLTAHGVKRWMVVTHTDSTDLAKGCGWAARLEVELQADLQKATQPFRYIERAEAEHFIKLGYTTRADIEDHNLEVQTASLKTVLAGTRAYVERGATLDTSTMFTDDLLTHVLIITPPSVVKYSSLIGPLSRHGSSSVGPYNTYYSQVGLLKEAMADARLLTAAFHIKDVRLVALNDKDHEMMTRWKQRLEAEHFMRGVGLTLVKLHHRHHGGLTSIRAHHERGDR